MSVQLYRAGHTHVVRGITCKVKNFDGYGFETMLRHEWYLNPEDIPEEIEIPDSEEIKKMEAHRNGLQREEGEEERPEETKKVAKRKYTRKKK